MGKIFSRLRTLFRRSNRDNIPNLEWKLEFYLKCLKEYSKIKMIELQDIGINIFKLIIN